MATKEGILHRLDTISGAPCKRGRGLDFSLMEDWFSPTEGAASLYLLFPCLFKKGKNEHSESFLRTNITSLLCDWEKPLDKTEFKCLINFKATVVLKS